MVAAAVSPFAIRRGAVGDLDRLVEIENAAFQTDLLSRRSLATALTSRASCLLVAEIGGRVVAYALANFRANSKNARLFSLARAPRSSRGSGRALLAAVEREAFGRGCVALRLEVRDGNARAIALYRKAGFRLIGCYDAYYEDGAPALRFEKVLCADAAPVTVPVPAQAPQGRKPRRRAAVR